jgi:hypothetical protein
MPYDSKLIVASVLDQAKNGVKLVVLDAGLCVSGE